jgi:uncharacterized protein with NRDE domain
MCLIAFAFDAHPRYRWVIAANRDEWYARPARPLAWWQDSPDVLGGRDEQSAGTWLALSRDGRLAALTNVRDSQRPGSLAPSRGLLTHAFLTQRMSSADYLASVTSEHLRYAGFNLLLDDGRQAAWLSNRGELAGRPQSITPGVHALSNASMDTPWPKVTRARSWMATHLADAGDNPDQLIALLLASLADPTVADDRDLPATGVPREWERALSATLIDARKAPGAAYGTRVSTVLLLTHDGYARMVEVNHEPPGATANVAFHLRAGCG